MHNFEQLDQEIKKNSKNISEEFKRIFHGRGGLWEEWKFLTVDSIDNLLLIQFFYEVEDSLQKAVIAYFKKFIHTSRHNTIVLKKRYIRGSITEVITGNITGNEVAIENGICFTLNLMTNQNIGYFGDMKNGRSFIESIAKQKHVLNLFAYTCGFSLFAKRGGAASIVNVDMSKSVLATGQKNHQINNLPTKGISFLPYNILKSFARLKKKGPYDIIIIDPPTFQKGSFEATKDYRKIITKLPQLASDNCTLLACLNAPDLEEEFLINMINELAPSFVFQKRLPNLQEYKSLDEKRSLKNLVFQREI
jgi:23S rRNA (cytosine1962-C5)-methyltransferase